MKKCFFIIVITLLYLAFPREIHASQFGMFYAIWHCRAFAPFPVFDAMGALYGTENWGPIPNFHWSGTPAAGKYCLANNDSLLRTHAEQLRDAGVDFVYVDITNWDNIQTSSNVQVQILDTFPRLLAVWNTVPNAPKIVPFVVANTNENMIAWLAGQMNGYPNMRYLYEGKPLLLVADFGSWGTPDENKLNQLRQTYTVRKMWGFYPTDQIDRWMWLSYCSDGFKASNGTQACNQTVSRKPTGSIEQISVSVGYQQTYMSKKDTAVPKFYGRTFRRQFETALNNRSAPIVTLNGWNEWIAQRFCLDGTGNNSTTNCTTANDHWPDGNKVFVDEYEFEYNRDIEPSADHMKDYYYQLTKACVQLHDSGGSCTAANRNNLCCKDYVGYDFGTPINPTNDGWHATNHLTAATTANGLLQTSVTGGDPFLYGPENLNVAAGPNDTFKVRMKISSGGTQDAQIYWTTHQSTVFDGNKAIVFRPTADNQWREYVLHVGWHPGWTGDVKQLRLDPISNTSSGTVQIDYIHLMPYRPTASPSPVPTPSPSATPRLTPSPTLLPTPTASPSYTVANLKTLLTNYFGTQDATYHSVNGKINMLDVVYVIKWMH